MQSDIFLSGYKADPKALIERCLLFMHDMKIITLQNGLGVFRQAMTLTLLPDSRNRQYTKGDYEPLSQHYAQKNVQVHVMEKYARLGLEKIKIALGFVSDYFSSSYDIFVKQHFPGQKKIIQTAMTAQAYKAIVQSLENHTQEAIIAAPLDKNILVLAGPGSGKTKTIVHRCAWLIKAKSVDPSSILVLCFNHQAMIELRKRIRALAGKNAGFVKAMTYHGFAMRLTGRSFLGNRHLHKSMEDNIDFDEIIEEAVDILNGEQQIAGMEHFEARESLLSQYRYILVDEYQDIDDVQYRFISALTGRLEQDQEAKISIMAVGDDDQSIYGFRNANIKFIKQFQEDYDAKTIYLVENYRSSHPIIQVSNSFIALNKNRMKTDWPCRINNKRKALELKPGQMDAGSLVQLVRVNHVAEQAVHIAKKIKYLKAEHPDLNLNHIAVISRQGIAYPFLVAVRMALAMQNIPFSYSIKNSAGFPMFKIREIQNFLQYLDELKEKSLTPAALKENILKQFPRENTWKNQIQDILDAWCAVNHDMSISTRQAKNFVLETLLEEKREQKTGTGVYLGTAHSVKGMEFDTVFILDGGWENQNIEEERRLFYVGMTRAKRHLYLLSVKEFSNPHIRHFKHHDYVRFTTAECSDITRFSQNMTVSVLGMEDLFLSYAGLFSPRHAIHHHLSCLNTGDRVVLAEKANHIDIENTQHRTVARLSNKGAQKWRDRTQDILNARVLGMIKRTRDDGRNNEFKNLKVEKWELPIIEVLHKKNS